MTSIPELEPHIAMPDAVLALTGSERCDKEIVAAEMELSAFLRAVEALYGNAVVARAADEWIALAGSIDLPLLQRLPDWRRITVLASSRLAMSICNSAQAIEKNEEAKRC